MMYKFIGIGLLAFLALLIIPVSSVTQSDDPSMYGMVTIALKDKSGNILFENQIHNEVVDQGTASMMVSTFGVNIPGGTNLQFGNRLVDGLCVSNAGSFSIADTETFTTFNTANTIDNPFVPCLDNITFIFTDTSATTGVQSFVADTAFAGGTIITGIGVCPTDPFDTFGLLGCNTNSIGTSTVLLGVIDITDIAVPSGTQLDVTYTLNLD